MIPCRKCKQHRTKPWPPDHEIERDWSTARSFGHTAKCQSRRVQLLGIWHSKGRTRDRGDRTVQPVQGQACGILITCCGHGLDWPIDDFSTTCVNMGRHTAICQHENLSKPSPKGPYSPVYHYHDKTLDRVNTAIATPLRDSHVSSRSSIAPSSTRCCCCCGSLIPVYAGSHVQVTDRGCVIKAKDHSTLRLLSLSNNNTNIEHSFPRVSTLNHLTSLRLTPPGEGKQYHATLNKSTSFRLQSTSG
jgi:hypothetical protein